MADFHGIFLGKESKFEYRYLIVNDCTIIKKNKNNKVNYDIFLNVLIIVFIGIIIKY